MPRARDRALPFLVAGAVGLGLTLGACGSAEDGASVATVPPAPSAAPATTETVAATPRPAAKPAAADAADAESVLTGRASRLTGGSVDLASYRGRVVLVVNTASNCGNTPQFEQLESLYDRKRGKGLVVLGFPSGDFGEQELSDPEDIAGFCEKNYGVSFPMFAKTRVTGDDAHPLFKRLIGKAGEVDWNFGKYLVDRKGRVVKRFGAYTQPTEPEVLSAIDDALS